MADDSASAAGSGSGAGAGAAEGTDSASVTSGMTSGTSRTGGTSAAGADHVVELVPDAPDLVFDPTDEPPVRRVCVVTGGNKGIGLEICRQLAQENKDLLVYLTARDVDRGRAALRALRTEGLYRVVFHQLDITSRDSCAALADHLEDMWGRLDILVNNAGFAYHGDTWGADEAATTIGVNYYGTMQATTALLPLLRKSRDDCGRIVNVASQAGQLRQLKPKLQAKFTRQGLTRDDISELMEAFIQSIRDGTTKADGWSNTMYGVSKLGEIAFTMVLSEELRETDMHINACCPGWCATDMSSHTGTRTAAKGAETPVWLATRPHPKGPRRGVFYYDMHEIGW